MKPKIGQLLESLFKKRLDPQIPSLFLVSQMTTLPLPGQIRSCFEDDKTGSLKQEITGTAEKGGGGAGGSGYYTGYSGY